MLLCVADILYVNLIRPNLKGRRDLDPLLVTAMSAALIAFGALGIYAFKGPQGSASATSSSSGTQPELTLLPPKDRYTFKWDPTTGMYFDIQNEAETRSLGQWANPDLILHNASKVAAADVIVTWQAEIFGIKELAKIGRLAKYDIRFPDEYTMDLIGSPPVPNFRYNPNAHAEYKIPFVARNSDLYLPLGIYPILGLFIAGKMPDELGAKTEPFPLRIDVSWNVPDGGEPQRFVVKIRGINTKPSGISCIT